MELTSSSFRYP